MAGRDVQAAGALLTADGTASGYVTVLNSLPFRVGAHAWLSATGVTAREVIIASVSTNGQIGVRYVDSPGTGPNYGLSDVSAYTVALVARFDMPTQFVDEDLIAVDITRQSAILEVDATPRFPAANDYLPVRLTDGVSFYKATGGSGGGGTSSLFGSPFPTDGTAAGFTDGVDMQGATVFDMDSGPGSQFVIGISLRKAGLGGSVELGTGTNPIRIDPTGTTPQPVTGTAADNMANSSAKLPVLAAVATTANPSWTNGNMVPLSVDTTGALRVAGVTSAAALVTRHAEIVAIGSGSETTIITVTASVTPTHVMKVEVSGENVALFRVKVNGTVISDKRTWWGAFNQVFDYPLSGLVLASGDVLTVTVIHNRPTTANFEATVHADN